MFALVTSFVSLAWGGTEAHLLRIDPRTSIHDGEPTMTAVIDLTQSRGLGEVFSDCATLHDDAELRCISDAVERPHALATPLPFPESDAFFAVRIGDRDHPAELIHHARFGESHEEPGIGTAWLIVLDADDRMGKALDEAQTVASTFLESLGPNDLASVVVLSDWQIAASSGWASRAGLQNLEAAIRKFEKPIRSKGRTRPLLDLIKQAATDSFKGLSNPGAGLTAPLHQALVVLSSGYGGGDPATSGPGAAELSKYFTRGRFDERNTALPLLPLPVISIYSPPKAAISEHQQIARSFMENLANPSIGGFFTALLDGQAEHARRIVDTVRTRFADMIVARFTLSCLAPSTTQSFSLVFRNESEKIAGDNTFQDVPLGFDPKQWPLKLDVELTRDQARRGGGIYPGGTVKVFGDFCWGTDITRPEAYFIPPGESLPQELSAEQDAANAVQKRLISLEMRAPAVQSNENFAEFRVPDLDRILHGEAERRLVRLVVVDTKMGRTSGLTESSVLTLKGAVRPFPMWHLVIAAFGALLTLLVLGMFLRRGSKNPKQIHSRSHSPTQESPYATPAPVTRIPKKTTEVRATLEGPAGLFTLLSNADLRMGRDGSRCAAVLTNPQVSGLHATFRVDSDTLLVRDEGSASGTRINKRSIDPGKWEPLRDGDEVSLGPEKLRVSWSERA